MTINGRYLGAFVLLAVAVPSCVYGQDSAAKCAEMAKFQSRQMAATITAARFVPPGPMTAGPGAPANSPSVTLPAYCRIEGIVDSRTGIGGASYGIGFAIAMPENWTRRFLMQGGGGLNGVIREPVGIQAVGNVPALSRGYAVASNDTGHKGGNFDGSFMPDQQAALDFYFEANGRFALLAKEIVGAYYGRPAEHSYFIGCSTGGREAMIMSQRFPGYFDGIVSGDPAIRTGHSNMGLAFLGATFKKAAQEMIAKADYEALFSDGDKKLILSAMLKTCDAKDGLADGMIFAKCDFDPAILNCTGAKTDSCIMPLQSSALKNAFAGPKDFRGNATYAAFPYDVGIAETGSRLPGLLSGPRIPVPKPISTDFDADAEVSALTNDPNTRLGDSTWTNLSSFSGHSGKLIFYHGSSDPWFSALDTLGYYERMARANGGAEKVFSWSRLFLVPGMAHCQGGEATLDQFDMLTAITDWVEKDKSPESVTATGRDFPGRSRPLCAYPAHAQYNGTGNPEDAANFSCQK